MSGASADGRMTVDESDTRLVVRLPTAPAGTWRWLAAMLGGAWLLGVIGASIAYLGWGVPDGWLLRVIVWIAAMALTVFAHVLAAYGVWALGYARAGTETFALTGDRAVVRRTALGVTLPFKIARDRLSRAEILDRGDGRTTAAVEFRSSTGAVRFGSALTDSEAIEVVERVNAFAQRTGGLDLR
ncbi:MAG: hypothetical protein QMC79_01100 [Anaerosomatales bacterium]|nr:hypothetical protein [Anaerosomatales bacterium]